jgi:hypothetical protein
LIVPESNPARISPFFISQMHHTQPLLLDKVLTNLGDEKDNFKSSDSLTSISPI